MIEKRREKVGVRVLWCNKRLVGCLGNWKNMERRRGEEEREGGK